MSETNKPVTDRMFFERLEQAREDANRESDNADRQQRRAMAAEAQVQRVGALATNWERLAATAMDEDVREWCAAAAKSVRAALAPVASDAESA